MINISNTFQFKNKCHFCKNEKLIHYYILDNSPNKSCLRQNLSNSRILRLSPNYLDIRNNLEKYLRNCFGKHSYKSNFKITKGLFVNKFKNIKKPLNHTTYFSSFIIIVHCKCREKIWMIKSNNFLESRIDVSSKCASKIYDIIYKELSR